MFGPTIVVAIPVIPAVIFVWSLFAILNASYVSDGLARNLGGFWTKTLILSGPIGSILYILPSIFRR